MLQISIQFLISFGRHYGRYAQAQPPARPIFLAMKRSSFCLIRLTQDTVEFRFEFCNFAAWSFWFIVWPSILSLIITKPMHETSCKKKLLEETVIIWFTFKPGLKLTGLRKTQLCFDLSPRSNWKPALGEWSTFIKHRTSTSYKVEPAIRSLGTVSGYDGEGKDDA